MYTPKIHERLIPCLYHAAQEQQVPMTKLTDAFVYHGLVQPIYGHEVIARLPNEQEVIHPHLKTLALSDFRANLEVEHYPFSSVEHLNAWYQSARDGLHKTSQISDPSEISKRQAEVAMEHLKAAYIAASQLVESKAFTEVERDAKHSA